MGGGIKVEESLSLGGARNIVLIGRTGNGKSSTANSILGFKAFESKRSCGGVTRTTEYQSVIFNDRQVVNVIDTPGLFDYSVGSEFIAQEIVKCIGLVRDGIHAVLLVLSIRGRFTEEEASVIQMLQTFFGPKITDYTIVVFTGGDDLEEDESLEDCLSQSCPEPLQKILKNRCVLFDNKTKEEEKKELQVQKLMSLVENVIEENGGHPYTDSLFAEYKESAMLQQKKEEANASTDVKEHIEKAHEEQLKVEEKLKVTSEKLIEQLAEEKSARIRAQKAEKAAREARKKAEKAASDARTKSEKAASDARKKAEEAAWEANHWRERAHNGERNAQMCSIM